MTRREALALFAAGPAARLSSADDRFLDDLSHRCFRYFLDQQSSKTGLVRDRARTNGEIVMRPGGLQIGSIAAVGFGMTAYCIGAERGWISREEAIRRCLKALEFFSASAPGKNGWFYHFLEMETGERRWECEVSSIDTALLMAGVLTARQYLATERRIVDLATKLYRAMDFRWMLNGHPYLLSHGWRPESGFIQHRWHDYSEETILYLMGIGAPGHSLSPDAWYAWTRPWVTYAGYRYLAAAPPLFIHQFSHAWVDYRDRREDRPPHVNYFQNSIDATRAHRQFCMDLAKQFPKSYSKDVWGITASDSAGGYRAWGGPPADRHIDGTVVPCAPGGSLMFTPDISTTALQTMYRRFGKTIWGRYGFCDAFNPTTGWVDTDVLGIDLGITLLSAENLRSGFVWRWFMKNAEISAAMKSIGLVQQV